MGIHLIIDSHADARPDRREELLTSVRRNLATPTVDAVYHLGSRFRILHRDLCRDKHGGDTNAVAPSGAAGPRRGLPLVSGSRWLLSAARFRQDREPRPTRCWPGPEPAAEGPDDLRWDVSIHSNQELTRTPGMPAAVSTTALSEPRPWARMLNVSTWNRHVGSAACWPRIIMYVIVLMRTVMKRYTT